MANLLVLMEFNRGALLPVSLEALGQARRLGSAIDLTVYALVPLPSEPGKGDSDITAHCGRFGADKVLLLTGDRLFSEQEMRYESYADAVMAACSMVPPRLLFAIARVESGRRDPATGGTHPWPWTINAEGRGSFFLTKVFEHHTTACD